jgi:tRNA 2-thiouridine synthesizing protein D
MIISLLIYASKSASQSEQTALRFAKSAVKQGHSIHRVFFYGDSVNSISNLRVTPRDEINLASQWTEFANKHTIDLVVCIAAAVKRGVLDENEAKRHNKAAANLMPGFQLSGLGQLADAQIQSDRLITFGN